VAVLAAGGRVTVERVWAGVDRSFPLLMLHDDAEREFGSTSGAERDSRALTRTAGRS